MRSTTTNIITMKSNWLRCTRPPYVYLNVLAILTTWKTCWRSSQVLHQRHNHIDSHHLLLYQRRVHYRQNYLCQDFLSVRIPIAVLISEDSTLGIKTPWNFLKQENQLFPYTLTTEIRLETGFWTSIQGLMQNLPQWNCIVKVLIG